MAIKKPPTWPAQIIVESTPEGPPTFADLARRPILISKGTASGMTTGNNLADIMGESPTHWVMSPKAARKVMEADHPGPGWHFDEKGQPRLGPCGHPVHWRWGCRICPLLADGERIACHVPNQGRISRAAGKWGGTAKKKRKANSYKPGPPPFDGRHDGEFDHFVDAAIEAGAQPNGQADGGVDMPFLPSEWASAVVRICPESSRTIRIRHGAYDEEDAIQIGDPWPHPSVQDIDNLDAMIAAYGSSIVHQQAAMTQNLFDFTLPEE